MGMAVGAKTSNIARMEQREIRENIPRISLRYMRATSFAGTLDQAEGVLCAGKKLHFFFFTQERRDIEILNILLAHR